MKALILNKNINYDVYSTKSDKSLFDNDLDLWVFIVVL